MSGENSNRSLLDMLKKYSPTPSQKKILAEASGVRLRADNDRRILEIEADFQHIIPKGELYELESGIREAYGINATKILPHYPAELFMYYLLLIIMSQISRNS